MPLKSPRYICMVRNLIYWQYAQGIAEDHPDCYWLYVVTDCSTTPKLQNPIHDPARFPWHEVKKVAHYYLYGEGTYAADASAGRATEVREAAI